MKIHPTAIIDPKAELDSSVEVGPHCIIEAHVRVGPGCRLYQNVYLTGWTEIGENCVLHPGAIVGHAPQDVKYRGERSFCRIGANTVLREYSTVHRGTTPESETTIGEHCELLAGCHVAHNCRIGNRVILVNNVLLAGHVEIHDGAILGGGVVVHQFTRIGSLVMVTGNAPLGQDLPPYAIVDVHGRVAGLNQVGLKRAGMPPEHVLELRLAYRTLYSSRSSFQEGVRQLEAIATFEPTKRLLAFLTSESKRGFAGRARKRL